MGKAAKRSRKGKKAWRANISTADIDEYFEKTTKDALAGAAALPSVPSDSLFYVDKSTEVPIKRKIEKHREKVLHYESLLQKNPYVQLVPSSKLKKLKRKKKKVSETTKIETQNASEVEVTTSLTDLWDNKVEDTKKGKKKFPHSVIPAIEVEPAGCSFNPPSEAHKESLAKAVAVEMQKIYEKELGPQPVPLTVLGEDVAEDDRYFLDADDGNESDLEVDEVDEVDSELPVRQQKIKRITRVELNRRARRKEQLRTEVEAKKVENLAKEIDSLPDIIKEIAKEDVEKQLRCMRRVVAKHERLKSAPPRLGKHKFEPTPIQVLLTEEISGSLRKLKGCATLTRDRFKSFEKRGLIAPSAKRSRKN